MSGTEPTFGIGMPVFNCRAYVGQAIEGILRQTRTDWQLFISDNASTDGTSEICRAYAAKDPRIVYERQESNRGGGWNFSHVAERSSGRYFCWAAADDDHAPTFLERCCAALEADSGAVIAVAGSRVIDENGEDFDDSNYIDSSGFVRRPLTPAQALERQGSLTSPSAARRFLYVVKHFNYCQEIFGLMRREAFETTGMHRPYYGADKMLLAEMTLRGKLVDVPEPLFLWRRHRGQSMWTGSSHWTGKVKPPSQFKLAGSVPLPNTMGFNLAYFRRIAEARLPRAEKARAALGLLALLAGPDKLRRLFGAITGRRVPYSVHGTCSYELLARASGNSLAPSDGSRSPR